MRLAWPLDQRRVCERCYRVPQGCRCIDTATSPEPCRNPKPGAPGSSRAQPKPVQQPKTKDFAQNKRPRPLPRPAPPMAASGSLGRLLLGPPPAIRVVTVPTAIGGRARLALVSRSGRTYVCRPAVVAACMVGCESLLREAATAASAESDADEISVEATASEISQLKACEMLGSRTARCTIVELQWAAGVVRSELDATAAASVELLCARSKFPGVRALPASLPTPAEEEEDDEVDEDDEGDDEAGAPPPASQFLCVRAFVPAHQFASCASRETQARAPISWPSQS